MLDNRLVIVGGGRMGEAIIAGLLSAGYYTPSDIVVVEPVEARRAELEERHGVRAVADAGEAAATAHTLLLAVKPQDIGSVLSDIDRIVTPDHLVISIAAGITTKFIESRLPHDVKVLRAMPNTPALVGAGVTALCAGLHAGEEELTKGLEILEKTGVVVKVKEELMDAVTAVSGSGPAYVFLFLEALIEAGVRCGLPRDIATELALNTVSGSAELMKKTGSHPSILREMVTSPGGTTAAGLAELEAGALRATVLAAVEAATERSKELGS